MAGDGPTVLLTREHVIPVLIEHEIVASTLRACDIVSTQKWDGRSERLTEKIYPNLTSKACLLSLWPQASKESKRQTAERLQQDLGSSPRFAELPRQELAHR